MLLDCISKKMSTENKFLLQWAEFLGKVNRKEISAAMGWISKKRESKTNSFCSGLNFCKKRRKEIPVAMGWISKIKREKKTNFCCNGLNFWKKREKKTNSCCNGLNFRKRRKVLWRRFYWYVLVKLLIKIYALYTTLTNVWDNWWTFKRKNTICNGLKFWIKKCV